MPSDHRVSTGWYWLAGVIALAGVAGAITWGFLTFVHVPERMDAFARTVIPGATAVHVTTPGEVGIYYEAPRVPGRETMPPLDIRVTDPSGVPVAVSASQANLRFDVRDHVAIAAATFHASSSGDYTVAVNGTAPELAAVSVGRGLGVWTVANVLGALGLLTVSILVSLAIAVVVAVRRKDPPTPIATPPAAIPRHPVGVG
jgi:hypothetical protein